jgi:catechol 2,3-dioxygenase-like lactoylglutathione lyase family enzyme
MANEIMIPALPCRSINETLAFYVAMGFEITYQQTRPNNYGCVKYENIDLHFFTLKGYEPKDSYSTCLVLVPNLIALHQTFTSALRSHYGKLPVAGIPRISKLNNANSDKQLRFNVVDPGGNWIRFIQRGEQPTVNTETSKETQSKLSRATQAADWLVELHADFDAAAKMLNKALADDEPAPPTHRVKALVLRASVAISQNDNPLAAKTLSDARQITLTDDERDSISNDLQRMDDLRKQIED